MVAGLRFMVHGSLLMARSLSCLMGHGHEPAMSHEQLCKSSEISCYKKGVNCMKRDISRFASGNKCFDKGMNNEIFGFKENYHR